LEYQISPRTTKIHTKVTIVTPGIFSLRPMMKSAAGDAKTLKS
jgi:hypothetical protein